MHAKEQIQPCSPSVQRDPGAFALLILSLGAIIGPPGVRLDARLRRYYTSGGLQPAGLAAREILRRDEPVAKRLGIGKKEFSDKELIILMVKHPDLIQRPIVACGDKAVDVLPTGKC